MGEYDSTVKPVSKGAAKTARWRANNPEKVQAWLKSERCRQLCREATARWRSRNPKPKKPLPPPLTVDQQTEKLRRERAAQMRRWKAKNGNFVHCFDYPDPPADSKCFNCGAIAKLHMDHDHTTGRYRGYLCIQCNMGIGQLGDSVEGLERALHYLRSTEN